MNRAYSLIEVKSLDEGKRTFSGWATTPDVDRVNDTINPLGAKFTNPAKQPGELDLHTYYH